MRGCRASRDGFETYGAVVCDTEADPKVRLMERSPFALNFTPPRNHQGPTPRETAPYLVGARVRGSDGGAVGLVLL